MTIKKYGHAITDEDIYAAIKAMTAATHPAILPPV